MGQLALTRLPSGWPLSPKLPSFYDRFFESRVSQYRDITGLFFNRVAFLPRFQFVNYAIFYKNYRAIWPTYGNLLLKHRLVCRKTQLTQPRSAAEWFSNSGSLAYLLGSGKRRQVSSPVIRASKNRKGLVSPKRALRYISLLWQVSLRIKLEQFFFKQVNRRTYVWLHNIWQLLVKKLKHWKQFETLCL
jgi:hypothetical protein